ncbi:VCBS repeat-containing protein [Streptomyces sp. NPDC051211]|uniref:FG-GAP repeat domain-containing protein n=1 Tax=Streptomyces sp. NPDC051211 TaxID=3154643 RepID=UPI00344FA046
MSSSARRRHLRRLAGCTALALSAAALATATPAAAADPSAGRSTYATAPAKPRLDIDGDGRSDFLERSPLGHANWWSSKQMVMADYRFHGEPHTRPMDIIKLGNVRGDARPEVLQLSNDGRLSLHQANTTGTAAPTWTGSGWYIYNRVLGAGDLTGDGRPDLLARTHGGDLYLYRATGNATGEPFAGRVKVGGGWQIYDQLVGAGDLDRDGRGDLLGRDRKGNLYYYKGTGSASAPFKSRSWVGGGWNVYSRIIAEDDQTFDGKADLLAVTNNGQLYEYTSYGNGSFSPRSGISSWGVGGWPGISVGQGNTPLYGKGGFTGIDAAGRAWVHENKNDGHYPSYDPVAFPQNSRLVMAAGVDGSARPAVLAFRTGSLTNVTKGVTVPGDYANTDLVVGPGDLTGDGKGDLLTRDIWGNLYLKAGKNNGVDFGTPTWIGPYWNTYKAVVGAGDINGDSRTDIVGHDWNGNLYIHPGTGNAKAPFGERQWIGSGWNGYNAIAATGDQDGDGRADIVARTAKGDMYVYRGTGGSGTSTFAGRQYIGRGWNAYGEAFPTYTQIG